MHARIHVHWAAVDESERDALAETLARVSRVLVAVAVRTVAATEHELTVAQHRVLVVLADEGTLSVSTIAQRLGVDQSTASRHCARLESLGLLARTRAEHDGRAVDVALTRAGEHQVRAVDAARTSEIRSILAGMPDEDARATVAALLRFDTAAHAHAANAAAG
jgi:DNA-binding MarR family transcriptional regulator